MNKSYKTTIFIVLQIVLLALLIQVILKNPTKESLNCRKNTNSKKIDCTRTLGYIFHKEQFNYTISDLNTVKLEDKLDARVDYTTLEFFVGATTDSGQKVVLLSVPEKNTSYATQLTKKIQQISQAQNLNVVFERSEILKVCFFILILLLLGAVFAKKFFKT